jgi:predicted secreted protein
VPKEKNHGLKNPRCMGICPQTLRKFDQNAASQQGTVVSASERAEMGRDVITKTEKEVVKK